MKEHIAEKSLSDGSKVTVERISTETFGGLMLVVNGKNSTITQKYLPDILKQKGTTAIKVFKSLDGTETFDSICSKLD